MNKLYVIGIGPGEYEQMTLKAIHAMEKSEVMALVPRCLAGDEEAREALVLAVISEIPCGQVASYGQIAELAGYPRHGRHVGKACSHSEFYGDYPCHRVVNHAGRLAPNFPDQRALLTEEGVAFRDNGCVDMKKCQWDE